jgi:hypothetical protein
MIKFVEKIEIQILRLKKNFFKNLVVYEIMWHKMWQSDRRQTACWIAKATHTHSQHEHVLLSHRNIGERKVPQCYVRTYVHCMSSYRLIRSISNITYNSLPTLFSGPVQMFRLTNYSTDSNKNFGTTHYYQLLFQKIFLGMLSCCVAERLFAGVPNVLSAFSCKAKDYQEIRKRQSQ